MRIASFILLSALLVNFAVVPSPATAGQELSDADFRPVRARKPVPAELRALRYLSKEVPAWRVKNKCFSCHNNGDAARSLFAAKRLRFPVPEDAFRDTSRWLRSPNRWPAGGGNEPFKDKKLARLQFTLALAEAVASGVVEKRKPLEGALATLIADQHMDGSWKVGTGGLVGSPATYGPTLATILVHRVLVRIDRRKYAESVRRAERWMRNQKPQSVLDAAALLWGLAQLPAPAAMKLERHCRSIILRGQAPNGGWGPFVTSAPEPFDTSIVLLALGNDRSGPAVAKAVRRGRAYLVNHQRADGSWTETTRPPGRESYAQRISTTGWVLLALLSVRDG